MLFNSYTFIIFFLPITIFFYYKLSKYRIEILVIASSIFYLYWSQLFFLILVLSILANYNFGKILAKRQNVNLLRLFIFLNIVLLFYFKYLIFILNIFSLDFSLRVILPLGISFYTFTQIAYLVDNYDKKECQSNITQYALFVLYFPHLIAGPVLNHKNMIMQFKDLKNIKFENNLFYGGVLLFIIGLLKKIIIADNISIFVDSVFLYSKIDAPSLFSAWAGALGYMFQLYFDFSGYSDMALGISRMFRIEIPVNFYSPYKSTNIVIFWSRWHISLSNFLRDYIYIRLLGGNRGSNLFRFKNIIITMLLGGVWHGAGMNFILWGLFHGILIVMTHIYTMNEALKYVKSWAFIKITINMLILCFLWVLFRAENLTSLNNMIQGMLNFNEYTLPTIFCRSNCTERYIGLFTSPDLGGTLSVIPVLFCAIVITFYCNNSHQIYNEFIQSKKYQNKTYYYIIGIISGVILLSLNKPSTFLYYQF